MMDSRSITYGLILFLAAGALQAQSPHGKEMKISCSACHTADSWTVLRDTLAFDHDMTRFPLDGQHEVTDCRQCHISLDFAKAETTCASCHLDVHQQTVGMECARCHNTSSWLVNNIQEVHRQAAFPLVGAHAEANCASCHKSETALAFPPISRECISCHQEDYVATTNPPHAKVNFSTDCTECHRMDAFEWSASGINHDFFPLTKGHDIQDCSRCHTTDDFTKISPLCLSCHEADYIATTDPDHELSNIPTTCIDCHTTDPGWSPAEFPQHDLLHFPIYSGSHEGEWSKCSDCHDQPGNYAVFTCISCHEAGETADEHDNVAGYTYSNTACLACHPNGEADGAFDHDQTAFPLTGAHTTVSCISCHASGYTGTPTECVACHNTDFNESVNPNHPALGIPTTCASCHTTDPEWNPATFDIHNEYYVLAGAHAVIANQCALCHQGDYTNTPTTCVGCHLQDYNQTTSPSHTALQFSTDCATCHSENAWIPATFDHDAQYFPIYSGSHEGQWSDCVDCHTTPGDFSVFTCVTCHTNPETDEVHNGVQGYVYNSQACFACHPTGDGDSGFDHNATDFPLTGAHTTVECLSCHANGYIGTPTECQACHIQDYQQSVNPSHTALGLSTDCASCHITDPGWEPAAFNNHNDYYVLAGAHAAIANQCASCHQGDYNNTPNACAGCHLDDYNATVDPPHLALQFSTDCASCHTEMGWVPSTFDHDLQHFPIYTGSHAGEWSQCADCHTSPGNFSVYTCTTCHANPETDEVHAGVNGYVYQSTACLACHPNGEGDVIFDHNTTNFPLTGAHTMINCLDCHSTGFEGTPVECQACHSQDYTQSLNPNHPALGISMDCATCHTTDPGWSPASFNIHDAYYVLQGAHALIATQCVTCHNGDYNNTPNTCAGCHQQDYNQTTDPPHASLQFSTECALCHNQSAWEPSTFDHDVQHFPIYTGSHAGQWSQCAECHTTAGDFTQFTCITCHANPETNEIHASVNGYIYESTACLACHPNGEGDSGFDHNLTNFPLTGAHTMVNCLECHANGYDNTPTECVACHNTDFTQSINPSHVNLGLPTDCASCHTTDPEWSPASFDIHNQYYVLEGAHAAIANQCATCHNGDYNNTPNTCFGCHQADFEQTTNPPHASLAFSNECATCHTQNDWTPAGFPNHNDYYVLEGAHAAIANECALCHNGDYNNTPNTCVGCHMTDFNNTTDPDHQAAGFGTDCASCHNQSAWEPASFDHDAQYFPIYSGDHAGTWDQCSQCHTNANDFSVFTCVSCHTNPETNNQHAGVDGYSYNSTMCLACHPTGSADDIFDHNTTSFPLTGAHTTVNCMECHSGGFAGTPTECNACHLPDYNQSSNPSHTSLNLPTDCISCHTTAPDWNPASFDIHNQFYVLEGAHAAIADDCAACHNGDYNNTPNTCFGCHETDYNQTNSPPHESLNFSTNCVSCHTQSAWSPAEYTEHDDLYFPIYSGGHEGAWDDCNQCHTNAGNYAIYTCIGCHVNPETNNQHAGVNGYVYENSACLACHPTGDAAGAFDHSQSNFPLTGAHQTVDCIECHAGGYSGTPTNCDACHMPDFNQSSNPDHVSLGLSTDCASCHTTNPDWNPALFPDHNDYYALLGAHADIQNQCVLCHNGNYNTTPNTCFGCHQDDYNGANDPNHLAAQFPTTCEDCHTQNSWTPANWDHDGMYFPIYSGRHEDEWNQCTDCHNNPGDFSVFTCFPCHPSGEMADEHDEVNGYQYNSNACLACHPDGED